MFGGDDTDPLFPLSMDNIRLNLNPNASLPMQLDVLGGCNPGIMNTSSGVKNTSMVNLPMELGRQKLPFMVHDNLCLEEAGQWRSMVKQIPVSTGLKLSYGEEEHNSFISSAGDSKIVTLSSMLPHSDHLQTELVRQNDEFDQYIRVQEDTIRKGITELKHRHTITILNALEQEVSKKLHEKDTEIENLNHKNKMLTEKIRQMEAESQSWRYKAQQNESIISFLNIKIQEVLLRGSVGWLKEGCGESMVVDDASSSCDRNFLEAPSLANPKKLDTEELLKCKACKCKEVSALFLPCRHLCLCTDCDFIDICPVCRVKKTGSFQVFMA